MVQLQHPGRDTALPSGASGFEDLIKNQTVLKARGRKAAQSLFSRGNGTVYSTENGSTLSAHRLIKIEPAKGNAEKLQKSKQLKFLSEIPCTVNKIKFPTLKCVTSSFPGHKGSFQMSLLAIEFSTGDGNGRSLTNQQHKAFITPLQTRKLGRLPP